MHPSLIILLVLTWNGAGPGAKGIYAVSKGGQSITRALARCKNTGIDYAVSPQVQLLRRFMCAQIKTTKPEVFCFMEK
jgi:hypothetical protein